MRKERKNWTGSEKMSILREHLIEHVPISAVCDKHGLQPTVFYAWQKRLFEGGAAVFENGRGGPGGGPSKRHQDAQARRIEALEAKLQVKNEVVAELMAEHVALKKSLGEL
jgi:transposase-like protein